MSVILNYDMRIFLLYAACQFRKECRSSDTCHIFKTDFIATIFHDFIHNSHIILHGMYRRVGDGESYL